MVANQSQNQSASENLDLAGTFCKTASPFIQWKTTVVTETEGNQTWGPILNLNNYIRDYKPHLYTLIHSRKTNECNQKCM